METVLEDHSLQSVFGFENVDFDFDFELFDEEDSEIIGSELILPDSPPDSSGCSEPYSPPTETETSLTCSKQHSHTNYLNKAPNNSSQIHPSEGYHKTLTETEVNKTMDPLKHFSEYSTGVEDPSHQHIHHHHVHSSAISVNIKLEHQENGLATTPTQAQPSQSNTTQVTQQPPPQSTPSQHHNSALNHHHHHHHHHNTGAAVTHQHNTSVHRLAHSIAPLPPPLGVPEPPLHILSLDSGSQALLPPPPIASGLMPLHPSAHLPHPGQIVHTNGTLYPEEYLPYPHIVPPSTGHLHHSSSPSTSGGAKKRKISEQQQQQQGQNVPTTKNGSSTPVYIKQEPNLSPDSALHNQSSNCSSTNTGSNVHSTQQNEEDYYNDYGPDSQLYGDAFYQCIRFTNFNPNLNCTLYDAHFKEVPLSYRVDADKGFNFSNADEAFVCQKKNHFQVTIHAQTLANPVYVKSPTDGALVKIEHFMLHFYGVKTESQTQIIKIEQSQSDRSKKAFHPVPVELGVDHILKLTIGRLHFSETTSNNMRKKGKPNPDQRYFYLVVSLCAHAFDDQIFQLGAQASERIIVRASNPGQFENDVELIWQKGTAQDSIFHTGKVGINTDRPDESLVVFGNAKITGSIMQPSDLRAKEAIQEVDTRTQLKNVSALRIVRYQFRPEFADKVGINPENRDQTGIIAQEVAQIIPDAVHQTGDVTLASGETIPNFLVVNKERIFMENLGAVKELCKVTDNLETRIDELERMNIKLSKFNRFDSIKSTRSSLFSSASSWRASSKSCRRGHCANLSLRNNKKNVPLWFRSQFSQTIIMLLVFIMAFCLASICTLFVVEFQRRHHYHVHQGGVQMDQWPYLQIPGSGVNPNVNIYYSQYPLYNHTNNHHQQPQNQQPPPSQQQQQQQSQPQNSQEQNRRENAGIQNENMKHLSSSSFFEAATAEASSSVVPTAVNAGRNGSVTMTNKRTITKSTVLEGFKTENASNNVVSQQQQQLNRKQGPSSAMPIRVLRPQVIGIPHDCQNDCPLYCCLDEHDLERKQNSTHPITTPLTVFFDAETVHARKQKEPVDTKKKKRTDPNKTAKFETNHLQETAENVYFDVGTKYRDDVRHKREINPPKKELSRAVENIKLIELNATVDYSYCTKLSCVQGVGTNFHYLIPVSKFMSMEYVTLQFSLNEELIVDHCTRVEESPVTCPSGNLDALPPFKSTEITDLVPETTPHWRLPIGVYFRSAYVFRILSKDAPKDSPCNLPENQAGISFIEYKFEFVRKCDK